MQASGTAARLGQIKKQFAALGLSLRLSRSLCTSQRVHVGFL